MTESVVKRGCGVRLLRDNIVIHEGDLSQLKRFKDDVKEVARNYECGSLLRGFNDLREGDVVECYEMEVVSVCVKDVAGPRAWPWAVSPAGADPAPIARG